MEKHNLVACREHEAYGRPPPPADEDLGRWVIIETREDDPPVAVVNDEALAKLFAGSPRLAESLLEACEYLEGNARVFGFTGAGLARLTGDWRLALKEAGISDDPSAPKEKVGG